MEKDLGGIIRTVKRALGLGPRAPYPMPEILRRSGGATHIRKPRTVTIETNRQETPPTPDINASHQWPEVKIDPNELRNRKN